MEHRNPTICRMRVVCISDTHNTFPKLPRGDILIHAGDLTNQGSFAELQKTLSWLEKADFKLKIVVAGNHDITLDRSFYTEYGSYFHNQRPEDPAACLELMMAHASSSLVYLNHETKTFQLQLAGDGTKTAFTVFGSPYSPTKGLWAFGYPPEDAATKWSEIPLDADIVVTHTPPKFHCDESRTRGAAGCEDLRRALWRVRPRLAICGHVHEGRGVESVLWDLDASNVRYKEAETFYWHDRTEGSKRQFRVDLTHHSVRPLQNDGGKGEFPSAVAMWHARAGEVSALESDIRYGNRVLGGAEQSQHHGPFAQDEACGGNGLADRPISPMTRACPAYPSGQGLGGPPTTGRSDVEALAGRRGRRETCVVNAAIAGSSWPHPGGKKFNKPIVIDIDMPTVDSNQEDCSLEDRSHKSVGC